MKKTFVVMHKGMHSMDAPMEVAGIIAIDSTKPSEALLEDVYEKTNNIETEWTSNPEVVSSLRPRMRSTSVGDYIITEEGTIYMVDSVGFVEMKLVAKKLVTN